MIAKGVWSANKFRKFAHLRTYKTCKICRSSRNVAICGFAICGLNFFLDICFADLIFLLIKPSENSQIHNFSLPSIGSKSSNSNLYLIKSFCQTNLRRFFGYFGMKGSNRDRTLLKEMFHPLCPLVKNFLISLSGLAHPRNWRICDQRTGTLKKFADFLFADLNT